MIRAALTQTIIILINILTRHELPLKDVVLNKFPHLFFKFFLSLRYRTSDASTSVLLPC